MPPLELGRRYYLPHGTGVFVAREVFNDDGSVSRTTDIHQINLIPSSAARYCFEIDLPNPWSEIMDGSTDYCAWRKDVGIPV